jgi:hypothetical protein
MQQERRNQVIQQFWAQVDEESPNLAKYQKEESYQIHMRMVHKQAAKIQKGLDADGTGHIQAHVAFPAEFFCALIATLDIDHNSAISFR